LEVPKIEKDDNFRKGISDLRKEQNILIAKKLIEEDENSDNQSFDRAKYLK